MPGDLELREPEPVLAWGPGTGTKVAVTPTFPPSEESKVTVQVGAVPQSELTELGFETVHEANW